MFQLKCKYTGHNWLFFLRLGEFGSFEVASGLHRGVGATSNVPNVWLQKFSKMRSEGFFFFLLGQP